MTAVQRFEDIEAWQKARTLARKIYMLTNEGGFSRDYGLKDQIRRAAVSVMSNIAEGFERSGDREFSQFLALAKGSVGELRSQLYVALDAGFVNQSQFAETHQLAVHTANLIGAFMRYLKSSNYRGPRFHSQDNTPPTKESL